MATALSPDVSMTKYEYVAFVFGTAYAPVSWRV